MEARRVRKWPSSFGIDIESNIIGFDIPGSQPGYFFQQQRSHAQNYQMQVDRLLLREPKRLRNLHNHRYTDSKTRKDQLPSIWDSQSN